MPEHNLEGRSERELRLQREAERGITRKCKKRDLKQLPVNIRCEIVRLYNEENVLQKNIADKYRISVALVGRLVREYSQEPEKEQRREANRQRVKDILEVVKSAVEEHTETN